MMKTPLRLASFERYMLADHRSDHPMIIFVRLRFAGRAVRVEMDRALRRALARHPLLLARVASRRWRGHQWVVGDPRDVPLVWQEADGETLPRAIELDLRRAPGLCVRGIDRSAGTDLILQFHHACCDGLGAFRFIEDLLVAYAAGRGALGQLRPLAEEELLQRDRFGLTAAKLVRMVPRQMVGLLRARRFLMHKPVPLTVVADGHLERRLPDVFPSYRTACLSPEQSRQLRLVARRHGTTVNEILIRDLFRAINRWRRRRHLGRDQEWIRLSIPINLRTAGQESLPAANVVSMVFLDRRREQVDSNDLLAGIRREMQCIKRNRLGLTFIWSLKALGLVPGATSMMTRSRKCMATCVLTNLGQLFRKTPLPRHEGRLQVGDLLLTDVDILAPIRRGTYAALATFQYANSQQFTMHSDPRAITTAEADELLTMYSELVTQSAATGHDVTG